jgi:phage tail sheath protein FI
VAWDGVTTGVPVFLGVAQGERETSLEPQRLTIWPEFLRRFGAASHFLAQAVQGFFTNGGEQCYVLLLPADDTPASPSPLTMANLHHGLQIIESLEEIDLVCVPDIMQTRSLTAILNLQAMVLEHCDQLGDRFAILDSCDTADLAILNQQRQQLVGHNGAIYAPWVIVESSPDPIPACGHIAGVYARNDREAGVHRAPANYILEGVLDLNLSLSDQDWATLNVKAGPGVNCIRSFRSRGIRVWGARTTSTVPGWHYVGVRRLIITMLRWADHNLAEIVFEPNNSALWVTLARELTVYCETLWHQGALQGADPEAAFYVKCDAETNPRSSRNLGQVVAEVGIAPTTPAEFIVISLVHNSNGITFA